MEENIIRQFLWRLHWALGAGAATLLASSIGVQMHDHVRGIENNMYSASHIGT